jgi:hypothetical protein
MHTHLTPEEERYKQKVWTEINGLVGAYLTLTEPDYKRLMAKVEAETLAQIDQARQAGRSPFEMEQDRIDAANRMIAQERDIELNGYHMSAPDFNRFLPTLSAVSFMPDLAGLTLGGMPTMDALFMASSPANRVANEGLDALTGVCDNVAVGGFVRTLRRNYEVLRRSRMLKNHDMYVVGSRHACPTCSKLDGSYVPTEGMLRLYELNTVPFPHELPSEDQAAWCPGPTLLFAANELFGLRG